METAGDDAPFWHTSPLHNIPYLLQTGCLYSQRRLRELALPIQPRRSAAARDRKLGLDDYVNLSFTPSTPLLVDKLGRGWPHALIEFRAQVFDLSGAAVVLYNHKAWRHREDFAPITDPTERMEILRLRREGRYPSAELLIPAELPLVGNACAIHLREASEAAWLGGLIPLVGLPGGMAIRLSPGLFPDAAPCDLSRHIVYADACRAAGQALAPPELPFD